MSKTLKQDDNRVAILGFAPAHIETVAVGGSLDCTDVLAIRVAADSSYQINGTGDAAVMPAGAVTFIAKGVTSLLFTVVAVDEVML